MSRDIFNAVHCFSFFTSFKNSRRPLLVVVLQGRYCFMQIKGEIRKYIFCLLQVDSVVENKENMSYATWIRMNSRALIASSERNIVCPRKFELMLSGSLLSLPKSFKIFNSKG